MMKVNTTGYTDIYDSLDIFGKRYLHCWGMLLTNTWCRNYAVYFIFYTEWRMQYISWISRNLIGTFPVVLWFHTIQKSTKCLSHYKKITINETYDYGLRHTQFKTQHSPAWKEILYPTCFYIYSYLCQLFAWRYFTLAQMHSAFIAMYSKNVAVVAQADTVPINQQA